MHTNSTSPNHSQKRAIVAIIGTAIAASTTAATVYAQSLPPRLVPFQARLTDTAGAAISDNVYKIVLNVYDQPTGGTSCWTEPHDSVSVIGGQVNLLLGSLTPLDDPNKDGSTADALNLDPQFQSCGTTGQPACTGCQAKGVRYLGITVGAAAQEMVPRHQLIPAFHARTAGISNAVVPGGITSIMIAEDAVTTTKIPNGALTGSKVADNSLTAADLGTASVTLDELAPNSVNSSKILDGSVTNVDIGLNAVDSGHIKDGSITQADLAESVGGVGPLLEKLLDVVIETPRVAYIKDRQSPAIPGGDIPQNANHVRNLNTIEGDRFVTLSCPAPDCEKVGGVATRFILGPGTYDVEAHASVYRSDNSRLRLFNVTANAPAVKFQSTIKSDPLNDDVEQDVSLYGTFSVLGTEPAFFELQQRFQSQPNTGGTSQAGTTYATGETDEPEVHVVIKLTKKEQKTLRSMLAVP